MVVFVGNYWLNSRYQQLLELLLLADLYPVDGDVVLNEEVLKSLLSSVLDIATPVNLESSLGILLGQVSPL